jgi:hypothetical protein
MQRHQVLKGQMLVDISGPSLNFLIKLMAVESLVFAPFFATHGGFNLQTVLKWRFYVKLMELLCN